MSFYANFASLVLARHELGILLCSAANLAQFIVIELVLVDKLPAHNNRGLTVFFLQVFEVLLRIIKQIVVFLVVDVIFSFFLAN